MPRLNCCPDFAPTTTATKVLLLPFAILTISQLGNQVSMIVNYFSERSQDRRRRWRKRYETVARNEAKERNPRANLKEELELVSDIAKHEEMIVRCASRCIRAGTHPTVAGSILRPLLVHWRSDRLLGCRRGDLPSHRRVVIRKRLLLQYRVQSDYWWVHR